MPRDGGPSVRPPEAKGTAAAAKKDPSGPTKKKKKRPMFRTKERGKAIQFQS